MNWKGLGRKRSWPNFEVLSRHLAGETEENHEKPQGGRSPGRDTSPVSPEHEAGVLITVGVL
jgi:hypothetical protein